MSKSGKKTKAQARAEASRKATQTRLDPPYAPPTHGDWAGKPTAIPGPLDKPAEELRPEELVARFGTIKGTLKIPYPAGTLTIAMIVKNEAKNIRDAIASFRPIADEIIVYDTGSTDGTQDILQSLGVKWIQGEWRGDFAWARNRSLEKAGCAWILWMDADDRIPEDQYENFRKLKTAPMDRAFGFQVINTQGGGLALGARFMQLRMFPNHPDIRFRYKVHEQLFHGIAKLGLHCFYTETTIHHTGYEDPELKLSKARRNLDLLEKDPDRVNAEPSLAMSVGDSHYILGEWEKGIEAYKRCMAMPNCEKINADIFRELPSCIGRGCQKLGRREEAITWYDKSIALSPSKHEPVYYKAECLMELGRHAEAETLFAKLISMPVNFSTTSSQYDIIQIYSAYYLAGYLFQKRDIAGARRGLETLNKKYPQVVESWHLLAKCQMAQGEPENALKSLNQALKVNPKALSEIHAVKLALLMHLGLETEYTAALDEAKTNFPSTPFQAWNSGARSTAANLVTAAPKSWNAAKQETPVSRPLGVTEGSLHSESRTARPALSLCMIVKNEKDQLPACLGSAKGLADEIIIVDTGSTDGTQDIARSFGAKLIQSDWEGDFSKARNLSLSEANGRWIVWLDADDRLLEEDKLAIKKLAEADPVTQPKGYGLIVKNTQDGGKTGSVFNQIRLFPNRPDLRFRAPVHEQILPALESAGVPIEYVSVRVLHTGYTNAETARAKQVRNKAILEKQIDQGQGITPVTYFTLANACADLGHFADAVAWFRKAGELAAATGTDPHIASSVPAKIAAALAGQKKFPEALEALSPALSGPSPTPEAVLVKGQLEEALGRSESARPWFEHILALKETGTFVPVDFQILKIQALQFLGKYWYERNARDLAVHLLKSGLAIKEGRDFGPTDLETAYRRHGIA